VVETWVTDEDLLAAQQRLGAGIPGLLMPAAYTMARADPSGLHFGHVNRPRAVRPVPAVILASCAAMWPPPLPTESTGPL
jgi:hypothetical protein